MADKKSPPLSNDSSQPPKSPDQVIVVHGHDTEMKAKIISLLKHFNIQAHLTQDKGNAFKPLADKAQDFKDAPFAIVILF